jgi:protein-L-isoaspartate(D-aspartate) O-methyltransferase
MSAGEMAVDPTQARERMVVEQLERRGITDPRVLSAMRAIPRDRFIPSEYAERAHDDGPLPIGNNQTISQPYMVALMTQVAAPGASDRVLEIGTGSGYQAAILCALAAHVYSIERIERLHHRARRILDETGIRNYTLRLDDGSTGWPEEAPFDIIVVTAAMPGIPRPLLEQLGTKGRLVAPIGEDELQTLVRIGRINGHWQEEYFGECRFVKMSGRHGFSD